MVVYKICSGLYNGCCEQTDSYNRAASSCVQHQHDLNVALGRKTTQSEDLDMMQSCERSAAKGAGPLHFKSWFTEWEIREKNELQKGEVGTKEPKIEDLPRVPAPPVLLAPKNQISLENFKPKYMQKKINSTAANSISDEENNETLLESECPNPEKIIEKINSKKVEFNINNKNLTDGVSSSEEIIKKDPNEPDYSVTERSVSKYVNQKKINFMDLLKEIILQKELVFNLCTTKIAIDIIVFFFYIYLFLIVTLLIKSMNIYLLKN